MSKPRSFKSSMNCQLDDVLRSVPAVRVGISILIASSSLNGCLYIGTNVRPAMCGSS